MYILRQKICPALAGKLTFTPSYQAYIHLQDHDKKVNPEETRLKLSFMDPKKIAENVPTNPEFKAKLRKSAEAQLRKRMFETYKQKILKGEVDVQKVVEPDTLWGEGQKPSHYYQNLSSIKANQVSHSIFKDVQQYQNQLVKAYVENKIKITNINDAKDVNQIAQVAASYRFTGNEDRQKYYQIEERIGKNFHLLTNQSLILLKYAFLTVPKKCTPRFNKILNDLIYQSLPTLSIQDLTYLMYFNRKDLFKFHKDNLQISVLEEACKHLSQLNIQKKIDFLFLYIDSRFPTIRPQSHNRHTNEVRNRTQHIMYHLNIEGDFSTLSQLSVLKLAYCLVRGKTNQTEHLTLQIVDYISNNLQRISLKNLVLFFTYLSKIQAGKSISDIQFMQRLKQRIVGSWSQLNDLEKLRSLNVMLQLNLYDQAAHQLYTEIPIQADSSMLSLSCRLQMMNSSGRQWEVIHRLTDLQFLPLPNFQDYKRFYNYVSSTAPDWNLKALSEKLENTQIFYSSVRYQSLSQDKQYYRDIRDFQSFSSTKQLPHKFKMGCPIRNCEFAQFCLPHYQISVDIITDVERIRGTSQLKGSYKLKMKNLQCIGWKQLYVFEEDIDKLSFQEFFDYLKSVCEPHIEQQLKVIEQFQSYRSYEISQMKFKKQIASMKMRQRQLYEVTKQMGKIPNEYNLVQKQIAEKEKIAQILLDSQNSMMKELAQGQEAQK